ncbi:MAG: hypothetical protein OJF47_001304 [Nitrospira sp.]|nr:MAG: hypothetical protein OJF47_001304 [Nitrospira sp.]
MLSALLGEGPWDGLAWIVSATPIDVILRDVFRPVFRHTVQGHR